MPVRENCPNKTAGPCPWRSVNNREITTAKEAQELADIHMAICSTNSKVIQRIQERQKEAEHNCQRDVAAEERATMAMDQQTSLKLRPLTRPTLDTKTTPDDYKLFLAKYAD